MRSKTERFIDGAAWTFVVGITAMLSLPFVGYFLYIAGEFLQEMFGVPIWAPTAFLVMIVLAGGLSAARRK